METLDFTDKESKAEIKRIVEKSLNEDSGINFATLSKKVNEHNMSEPIKELVSEVNEAFFNADINRAESATLIAILMERVKE